MVNFPMNITIGVNERLGRYQEEYERPEACQAQENLGCFHAAVSARVAWAVAVFWIGTGA
jgi:predicted metal-dependent phosphoesterase TrpH